MKMQCAIYKGRKKEDTYIFLQVPAEFEKIPAYIYSMMGELLFVMELEILDDTKLARNKAVNVLNNINENGFHIQLPPKDEIPDVI